jgi:hypothetical protein
MITIHNDEEILKYNKKVVFVEIENQKFFAYVYNAGSQKWYTELRVFDAEYICIFLDDADYPFQLRIATTREKIEMKSRIATEWFAMEGPTNTFKILSQEDDDDQVETQLRQLHINK